MSTENRPVLDSDALKANLLETAVDGVSIKPAYAVLLEVVSQYKGIQTSLDALLYEISHPYRNWNILLPKLRSFVLKNINHYLRHERGPEAVEQLFAIFFEAIEDLKKNEALLTQAQAALFGLLEKYLQIADREAISRFGEQLRGCFSRLEGLPEALLLPVVQGHYPMKKLYQRMVQIFDGEQGETGDDLAVLRDAASLLKKILTVNYHYWLNEEDPLPWFVAECGSLCEGWEAGRLFQAISHKNLHDHWARLEKMDPQACSREELSSILDLPGHMDIVRLYRQIPDQLGEEALGTAGVDPSLGADRFAENRKLLFLFRIMDTAGLSLIHEETLREINRSLILLVRQQSFEEIERFLLTAFQLLKANVRKYPHTSLQCIQVLGSEIFKRENSRLVEAFLWEAVRFGFQYASVSGTSEEWQPIANPAHLANIRVWLSLIMQEPKWCSTLFSALIINLKLSGTCIKDTDLFQRDLSQLLNHPVEPVYNLVKQFTKLMPVYFNEIGAEGLLRDVSTELDEIHSRRDKLIHFLRKQSHVESSNLIVDFIESIFLFWKNRDKAPLIPFLSEDVLRQIDREGQFVDTLHLLMERVFSLPSIKAVSDLLSWDDHQRKQFLANQKDLDQKELRRFDLLVEMYTLVHQKYNLGIQDYRHQLLHAANAGFPEMEELLADLEECDTIHCLMVLLKHLEALKNTILSPEIFEAKEDIYHKRHIAVDIPSVYGRYRERKFDALGLTFRLENLANLYLEKLPQTVNLSFITRATFIRIIKVIRLYLRALKIDGISSRRLDNYLELLLNSLGIKRFSYTQYLDIFRGMSEGVKDVIYTYYTNIHQNNLSIVIPQIGAANLLGKYRSLWQSSDLVGNVNRLSETFMRDLISSTFGLQHLDNFITQIYQTLERQKELLDERSLDLLMTYNPDRAISFLHQKNLRSNNLILLGNKGFNLTMLAANNNPVPPGFIITTEIFRCWSAVADYYKARDEFMGRVRAALNEVERMTGKGFGDPQNPLLLSVRSGAAISMPGMMATIHNVGLNEEIVAGIAAASGKEYLAWDNYRRFLQSWAMTQGVAREVFQALMDRAKEKHNVTVKRDFAPEHMRELALEYQNNIRNLGIAIPEDPWLQLIGAVEMVLESWNTDKTREYRSLMNVSDLWGTAVIVQAMVFGNLGTESGSGVLFTAHPYRKVSRVALWGDYAPGDQGEDIVSGLVATYPVSVEQAEIDGRPKEKTLELSFPNIYQELLRISRELVYEKRWNPQEIEFTFEGPKASDLFLLQTRDMITIKKRESLFVFEKTPEFEAGFLGMGIGVSGSALSGKAVFTEDNIRRMREEEPETQLILIRQDTVPEDIKEIALAEGLLTARGGQTSHASVVATRLEKTCVVGCNSLKVFESEERCEINGHEIRFGEPISIDGRKGLVARGLHAARLEVHILPL